VHLTLGILRTSQAVFYAFSFFLVGRLRRPRPSAGNANRWAASPRHKTAIYLREKMNQYLVDTKYATENLFTILYQEHNRLNEALKSCKLMKDTEKNLFTKLKQNGFTPEGIIDLYGLSSAAEKFEEDSKEIAQLLNSMGESLNIVAGAVLQIAKQGISAVYRDLSNCPNGRIIGNESIKNIIWQGRNQAMHFEEGRYKPPVTACFQNLENVYGSQFQLARKNLAFSVIHILGWTTYAEYERDMQTLIS
jgi:hypothetical protein